MLAVLVEKLSAVCCRVVVMVIDREHTRFRKLSFIIHVDVITMRLYVCGECKPLSDPACVAWYTSSSLRTDSFLTTNLLLTGRFLTVIF